MNINLSGSSAAAAAQQRRDALFSRGILLVTLLLVVVIGGYFALRVYDRKLADDIKAHDNRIAMAEKDVSGERSVRVVNALYRIEDARRYDVPGSVELETLDAISRYVMSDVRLEGYEYAYDAESRTITVFLEAKVTDFLAIARQIENLKQAKLFDDVAVDSTERDPQTQDLMFTLKMKRVAKDKTPGQGAAVPAV